MQIRTYNKAAALAEFIFDELIKDKDMDHWNCLNRAFLASLPYSVKITKKEVKEEEVP